MKGINGVKHQEMKLLLLQLEQLMQARGEAEVAVGIRHSREAMADIYQQYRDTIQQLDWIIQEYEQRVHAIRATFLTRSIRKIQRERYDPEYIRQLVHNINSLAR
jgi:ABC-type transporter Mla subunit MlaD